MMRSSVDAAAVAALSGALGTAPPDTTPQEGLPADHATFATTAPPVISLPKGGGALRGIDEKLTANPVTGTATVSIPIATAPGRSGLAPSLALTYDSGTGNGPYGLGWSLSVDSVTRRTDRGLPRYEDRDESDIFVLSGAEDLVPALVPDGAGGWRRDTFGATWNGRAHTVWRYRPRIEGQFIRIERWVDSQSGETHWRTQGRDNVTSLFGTTPASRVSDPADPARVFTWLLDLRTEGRGDATAFEYKAEDGAGVAQTVHELNRTVGANRYLKRVRYGCRAPYDAANPPGPENWLFEIVLDYGEHDLAIPHVMEDAPWPARPDAFSSYRAGFEVRTHRICHRILVFHRFAELGDQPCLVQSTDLTYGQQTPVASLLTAVTRTGYLRDAAGGYDVRDLATGEILSPLSMPPVEMAYTAAVIDEQVHAVTAGQAENLPAGGGGSAYQWIDLDGEGLPGVLVELPGAWYYLRNVSQLPDAVGRVAPRWEPAEPVARVVSVAPPGPTQQLMDLAGDGRLSLVEHGPPVQGYSERDPDGGWGRFTPFESFPNVSWTDPNLRVIDLDGDGFADVLVNRDDRFLWFSSLATAGFSGPRAAPRPADEDAGPLVSFVEETQSVFLADMTGDGLTDIVRVRSGEVCYWPNLGYGRFGRKVTMDGAPAFDSSDEFDPRRLRLADIDGSGTTDFVYLGRRRIDVWANQSGNSWSPGHQLTQCPPVDSVAAVSLIDLLGAGKACLVWSSPLLEDSGRPMAYIDLMGGQKPHLLTMVRNNMGAETRVDYAPSTRYYLEDRAAGTPWVTRLAFPVQVVDRIETFDFVTRSKLVTRYRYHHGYYDGPEREFRGFGLVEQWDTESFPKFSGTGLFTETPETAGEEFHLPPVLTKTWSHTGAYLGEPAIARQFAHEYYAGDAAALSLPDTALPDGLTAQERREAARALKGRLLRQELYAEDGTPSAAHPYTVLEKSYAVRMVQPLMGERHAVFVAHEEQSIDLHYERNPADPRVTHELTLALDAYGNVLQSASIAYPRRPGRQVQPEQAALLVTASDTVYINVADQLDWYRLGVVASTRTHELTGFAPDGAGGLFTPDGMRAQLGAAAEILFDATPSGSAAQKRLLAETRNLYRRNDLSGPLPAGQVESLALPWESYRLAFSTGLLTAVYRTRETPATLLAIRDEGAYLDLEGDGSWWVPSGRTIYSPDPANPDAVFARQHFYVSHGTVDPFGRLSAVTYDGHVLLPVRVKDAVGNTVAAQHDYRVLQPSQVTDANDNVSAAATDALGMVVATTLTGKGEGDTLADPTVRLRYDLHNWRDRGLPVFVHTLARVQHGPTNLRWQESYVYSGGMGREVLHKVQAEPGPAPSRDANDNLIRDAAGNLVFSDVPNRWVGTGRIVVDNKGNPVKSYEPFFDSAPVFDADADLVQWGVTPIMRYDPLSRLIRTDHPDGSFSTHEFDAWTDVASDGNDTVLTSRWYSDRGSPDPLGPEPAPADARAAWLAAHHAHTPATAHLDPLGRTFLSVADNGPDGRYETRLDLDIAGRQRAAVDPLGRVAQRFGYDLLGHAIHQSSIDTGERWRLTDVTGRDLYAWDDRGHRLRHTYDEMRRPVQLSVRGVAAGDIVVEQTTYGEGEPGAAANNLRTRVFRHRDTAGVVVNQAFDFKGNLLSTSRQLLADYRQAVNWAGSPALDTDVFSRGAVYDALNRPTAITLPDSTVVRLSYNEAALLEQLTVGLRGAAATPYVANLDYNARGQRTRLDHGNGTSTTYTYDPLTFRLSELRTTRGLDGSVLQDLTYTYDPCGNVTQTGDAAQPVTFFANQAVDATARYVHDAIYRLISAAGREHIGQVAGMPFEYDPFDAPRTRLPLPTDGQAMATYREAYTYDAVGNLLRVAHTATNSWTRSYAYPATSNRLQATSLPGDPAGGPYTATCNYDAHGSTTTMPHLRLLSWDFLDRLESVDLGGGGIVYHMYDAKGERLRKVLDRQNGTRQRERISLDGFEVYREYAGDGVAITLERQSVHVVDGTRRVALVETRTSGSDGSPAQLARYQYANHLGSAVLEVDGDGAVISYEEYYPYGATAMQAVCAGLDRNPKRFRFTARERDEETGFTYHGMRYCAPWLGRWISCDPAGSQGGANLYEYAHDSPIGFTDPDGRQPQPALMGLWQYGKKIAPAIKAALGWNVQVDHPVQVAVRAAQRGISIAAQRAASRAAGQLGLLVETGKGLFHTELGKLQRVITQRVLAGTLRSESDLLRTTKAAYLRTARALKVSVNRAAVDQALLMDTSLMHQSLSKTVQEVRGLPSGGTTALDLDKAFEATFDLSKAGAAAAKVSQVTAEAEKAATAVKEGLTFAKVASKGASVLKAVAKPLAVGAKALGEIAGPVGLIAAGAELATAKTSEQKVDAGISGVSSALMMAGPVGEAAGTGLMAGQFIEKSLNVSEYASKHGMDVYQGLKKAGVNETAAFVAGGVVTVVSTPVAIGEAAADKATKWIRGLLN